MRHPAAPACPAGARVTASAGASIGRVSNHEDQPTGTDHPPATGIRSRASDAAASVRRLLLVLLGALIALFAVVNSRDVAVRWIFGDPIQTPLIAVIVVSLVVGVAIGWLAAKLHRRS